MANPRTPAAKAKVSGAAAKNPQRHKNRKTPKKVRAIGPPYKGMTKEQIEVWREQVENMPWLHAGHRLLLRQVCILGARMATDPDIGISAMHALGALLSKLGATPVDETKVNHGDGEDDDEDEKHFG
jgi:hypothetical protein